MKDFGLRYQDSFLLTRNRANAEVYEAAVEKIGMDKAAKIANLLVNKKVSLEDSKENVLKNLEAQFVEKKTDTALLAKVVKEVTSANEKAVAEFKSGKEQALMFLLGQVMRQMKGQADAKSVKEVLENELK